jgi:hypothetical protein
LTFLQLFHIVNEMAVIDFARGPEKAAIFGGAKF